MGGKEFDGSFRLFPLPQSTICPRPPTMSVFDHEHVMIARDGRQIVISFSLRKPDKSAECLVYFIHRLPKYSVGEFLFRSHLSNRLHTILFGLRFRVILRKKRLYILVFIASVLCTLLLKSSLLNCTGFQIFDGAKRPETLYNLETRGGGGGGTRV